MGISPDMDNFLIANGVDRHLRVEADLGNGYVRLCSEEAQRRQAIHDIRSSEDVVIELLRNARDAGARKIYVATAREGTIRSLVIIDDGCGIPASLHELVFEPRVTSKLDTMALDTWGVHGRGMALYSIRANAKEAHIASSRPQVGTAIVVTIDTDRLSEKRDQSSYPTLSMTEENTIAIRGPKNIIRTICEFALDTTSVEVYLGSPTEIASTLFAHGKAQTTAASRTFNSMSDDVSFAQQLACANTPAEFQTRAATLGLLMSERSARRIMDGEIEELSTSVEQLTTAQLAESKEQLEKVCSKEKAASEKQKGCLVSFSHDDLIKLQEGVHEVYRSLAQAYYLDDTQQPSVRFSQGALHITIPVEKQR